MSAFIPATPIPTPNASGPCATARISGVPHPRICAPPQRRARWTLTAAAVSSASSDADADSEIWTSAAEISSGNAMPDAVLTVEQVMEILPHRYPFLLLDRVVAYEPGKRAVGVKAVTVNEPFFPGHFPDRPIMPGVLQVEALAQLGGIVMLQPPFVEGDPKDMDFFFGAVDKVKWRKPVVPGDTLVMEMTLMSFKKAFGIAKMEGKAYVNGDVVVQGLFTLVFAGQRKK